MSDLRRKRRDHLINAAREVFVLQGYRAATMEGIAARASVSKATLYSYFPDKQTVFAAVAKRVSETLLDIVETELGGPNDPVAAVVSALTAKHLYVHALVRTSGFASDLFAANTALGKAYFDAADAKISDAIAHRLAPICPDAAERAELVLAAGQGIANATATEDQLRARLAQLSALIAPPGAPNET